MVSRRKPPDPTLSDHPSEETFACRVEQVVGGREASCWFTSQGDQVGISTKAGNVLLHPTQSQVLIPKTLVARGIIVAKGEEAKRAEPIVDGDQDHIVHRPVHRPVSWPGMNILWFREEHQRFNSYTISSHPCPKRKAPPCSQTITGRAASCFSAACSAACTAGT